MWIMGRMTKAKHIADQLGQAKIALALGVGVTAVNNAVSRKHFPATWYPVIRDMCRAVGKDCPESAFNFKSPSSDVSQIDGSLPSKDVGSGNANVKGAA
jgi:hypothetical protein